jgi:hypothetical protein
MAALSAARLADHKQVYDDRGEHRRHGRLLARAIFSDDLYEKCSRHAATVRHGGGGRAVGCLYLADLTARPSARVQLPLRRPGQAVLRDWSRLVDLLEAARKVSCRRLAPRDRGAAVCVVMAPVDIRASTRRAN